MIDYSALELGYYQGFYDRTRGIDFLPDYSETDSYSEGYRQGWSQGSEHGNVRGRFIDYT